MSVDPIQTVYEFVAGILPDDATIQAFAGDSVYPERLDIDDGSRFISYSLIDAQAQYYVGDNRAKDDAYLDVDVVGGVDDDSDDLTSAVARVRELLHKANGDGIIHCKFTDIFNVPYQSGDRRYPRRTLRFKVLVQ